MHEIEFMKKAANVLSSHDGQYYVISAESENKPQYLSQDSYLLPIRFILSNARFNGDKVNKGLSIAHFDDRIQQENSNPIGSKHLASLVNGLAEKVLKANKKVADITEHSYHSQLILTDLEKAEVLIDTRYGLEPIPEGRKQWFFERMREAVDSAKDSRDSS